MKKLALLLLACASAWAQTAVNDRLYLQSSAPWRGQITVSWPAFTACDGKAIAKGSRTTPVTDGTIGITLWATDCAAPSFAYSVRYTSSGNYSAAWSEDWAVPSSPSIVTLADVRQTSTMTVFVSQLAAPANTLDGQVPAYDVVSKKLVMRSVAGVSGNVTSVAGRTGDVVLAMSDIAGLVAALAGKQATITGAPGAWPTTFAPPLPGASTLGGVQSKTCSGTDKLSAIGTDGLPVCSTDQTGSGLPSSCSADGSGNIACDHFTGPSLASRIWLTKGTAPSDTVNPNGVTQDAVLYMDSADDHIKVRLIGGSVVDLTAGGSTQAADPTFSPVAGSYTGTQAVAISTSTSGATICYTTDGSSPAATTPGTCSAGSTYSTAVSVASSSTLKALATKSGIANSNIASAAYTISSSSAAVPTFSPAAGTYGGTQTVSISTSTSGATICYTTDGTTPAATTPGTCSTGSTYSAAVSVASNLTIKALATKASLTNSSVASAAYTISGGGVNIGDTAIEASDWGGGSAILWQKVTTGSNVAGYSVSSMSAYFSAIGANSDAMYGVYTESSGKPGSKLCTSPVTVSGVPGWQTVTLTGCGTLAASTNYWIGVASSDNGTHFRYGSGSSNWYSGFTYSTTWPTTAPATSGSWGSVSAYLTVVAQ